ncbi:MAG: hypothetical protein F4Y71_07365 [Acidobacteria bacterium]|nr:hypothetical protein [Acidobacteriota bacterium]MYF76613.1 hypothetical protein [Acidobacteriota bacterium]MYG76530.1 hypothetical protein [Acidobacteriota bacterium]
MIPNGSARTWALVLPLLMASLSIQRAAGQDKAPRRPVEPFRVFVHTSDPGDDALRAALEEALPMVRERVERRRHWFQLVGSPEDADLTLRLVNYRTGQHGDPLSPGSYADLMGREFHFLDAIVLGGGERTRLSGLDERDFPGGPGLRNAASHLAEELERFCKENYAALMRLRMETRPDPR